MKNIRDEYVRLASMSLKAGSRFYREDVADLKRAAKTKSPDELRESIGRLRVLHAMRDEDIPMPCFAGLGR
jgi:hypothetical protein